ncbi:MAG: hypothetical protein KGI58_01500 [Patescibacteria group bacterium]|nr:hypothetical protein [Patescibacteria group bacterium]
MSQETPKPDNNFNFKKIGSLKSIQEEVKAKMEKEELEKLAKINSINKLIEEAKKNKIDVVNEINKKYPNAKIFPESVTVNEKGEYMKGNYTLEEYANLVNKSYDDDDVSDNSAMFKH